MNLCIHCGQEAMHPFFTKEEPTPAGPFCCQGCLTVYNVINFKGLSEYYSIKKDIASLKKRAPVEPKLNQFSYLDDKDFRLEYSYENVSSYPTMEFYLEGIHCLACLWIIEKLPTFVQNVRSSKLNMARSVVTVSIESHGKFAEVARELESIGYRPHPLKINQSSSAYKIKENRSMLMRIGIAGAASGNIMLYAISLYAGAGIEYAPVFNALTVLFAIPVLTYSAYPFYRNSFVAFKNRTLSIDVPISIALIMGGLMGLYNLFNGIYENYLDSLTALVFLLLLSRYFLKIIQEKGLGTSDLHFFYYGESVLKMDENSNIFKEIHPKFISVNDKLKILPNQIIPADGVIISGNSYLNNSLLTGESQLQKVQSNDIVFSGTMNISNEIVIKVTDVNSNTRLGEILKSVENGWGQKAKIVELTNVVSKYFVAVVFILSFILFFLEMRNGTIKFALEKALTLLIVTCPCALAIATPLAFIRTLSKNAQKGIIIKDDAVIEKLSKAQNFFIDKTGTLTLPEMSITEFQIFFKPSLPINKIIYTLEKTSFHPVARCLMNYIKKTNSDFIDDFMVNDFKEVPGIGVSGFINDNFYEIKNYAIYENKCLLANFKIQSEIRPDSLQAIQKLRSLKLNLKVLSGDNKDKVLELAHDLKLGPDEYLAEMSPENKSDMIKNSINTVMIGDGANDSIALSNADIGIAVHGAMDISLRAADVYLTLPGLTPVIDLIITSKETMKVVYRNLILSLFYNSISVVLAFTGRISPLTAAVIMPLSSLTVLISTIIGTKNLRIQWKS